MNQGPNLWWVYDTDEKSFSTLPTGPFLVPALFIAGLSVLWRSCFDRQHTTETIAGELVNTAYWQAKRKRQLELVQRLVDTDNNLELHERHELQQLKKYLNNPYGY
jgi:hypothetical protein